MNPVLWFVSCAIGSGVLVVLAMLYRRARSARELELAEEILEAELDTKKLE